MKKQIKILSDLIYKYFRYLITTTENIYYKIIYIFQFIFRKNHIPDKQIWNAGFYIIKYMYPRIKAFIELNKSGFPFEFSEYSKDEGWESKKEYDQAIKDGKMIGGGEEGWNKILTEILFACEYTVNSDGDKPIKNFYKKWDLEDPYEKKESNKYKFFDDEAWGYYNTKLDSQYEERARKGFKLLGKYILTLWD